MAAQSAGGAGPKVVNRAAEGGVPGAPRSWGPWGRKPPPDAIPGSGCVTYSIITGPSAPTEV